MPIGVSNWHALRRALLALARPVPVLTIPFWPVASYAERSTFKTYAAVQGLTNLEGHCLARDRAGNVLICTQHGVFAYDGRRFNNLGTEHGLLEGGVVYATALTASGRVAIQYANGVYVSDQASDPSHPATSLSFHPALHPGLPFFADRPHRLVAQRDGFVFVDETATVRIVTAPGQPPRIEDMGYNPEERDLLQDATAIFSIGGRLWETSDSGRICTADPGAVRCYDAKDGLSPGPWFDMAVRPDGSILARSATAVATLDPGSARWSSVELPDQGGSYETFQSDLGFYVTPDGTLITQAVHGLDSLGRDGWKSLTVAEGAPNGIIAGAITDATGQLWFNILGRGLVRWVGYGHWETLEKADGLSEGYSWQTARVGDGPLWVTTDNGIDQVERQGASLHVTRVIGGSSYAIAAAPQGDVWAGSRDGIRIIHPATGAISVLSTPGVETIVSGRDDTVWIGTARGLYKVDAGSRASHHPVLLKSLRTPILSIVTDADNGIFYLCAGRLHHWRSDGADVTISGPGLPDSLDPHAMAVARDGRLWIGGSGGLVRVALAGDRIGSSQSIPTADTRTTTINALMVDHRGWIWVGTSLGVSVNDGTRWVTAEADQGLLSNDTNEGGIREDPDGSIWITTPRGVSHLRDPASLFAVTPLDVTVTDAHVGPIPVGSARLPYTDDPLSLEFGTPSHGLDRPVLFRHQLSGVDVDWVASSSAIATYPFVPPGRHVLTVVAYDQLSHASSRPTMFVIDMGYPWWRRWWSETLWAAVSAGLIYAGVRVRYRSMYARQAELQRLVTQATEQLRHHASHDGLTGLLTRGEIETRLAERLARERPDDELVVALLDIDHFKRINDEYGHLGGDEILRALGRSVSGAMRHDDHAGRYGGEEMLLMLADTDGCAAERVLDLHHAIRRATFRTGKGEVRVTCSIGVAWANRGDNWESLIGRADAALYEAKRDGRDRVVESRLHEARMWRAK